MKFHITTRTTESEVFDAITSPNAWGTPFVFYREDEISSAIDGLLFYLWVLGYPIYTGRAEDNIQERDVNPVQWNRPMLIRTAHPQLADAISRLCIARAPEYELIPASVWDIKRAIIDAALHQETDNMLPTNITKVIIAYGYEEPPLPKADIYFLYSQLLFHYIPDEHVPRDIIVNETKPVFINEIGSNVKWSARQPVACVIDKRLLHHKEIEHIEENCTKLRIPTIPPSPQHTEHFKMVLYPVSERFMHYSLPRTFTYILSRFTYIITSAKGVLFYPMVYRDVSYAADGELLAHCLLAYSVYKDIIENDAAFRLNEFVEFLKRCTWEGNLFLMMEQRTDEIFVI